jgi:hypothetical protein
MGSGMMSDMEIWIALALVVAMLFIGRKKRINQVDSRYNIEA